jgi:hypothetical protein
MKTTGPLLLLLLTACVAREPQAIAPAAPLLADLPSVAAPAPPVVDFAALLHEEDQKREGEETLPFAHVEVVPVSGRQNEYVAIADWTHGWFGCWCWFRMDGPRIAEIVWSGQVEQSMHKLRAFSHPLWEGVIVEAYGMTHMGNGCYYLFHVHHGGVETLITTRAVDAHLGSDGAVLQESDGFVMPARYYDFDKDGFTDVVLQGRVVTVKSPDQYWAHGQTLGWDGLEHPVRKVFLWSPDRAAFERARWLDIGTFD